MQKRFLLPFAAIAALAVGGTVVPARPAAAQEARVARISGGVMAGQILHKVDPEYPAEARAGDVQGAVVLHALIGTDGTVKQLVAISGPELLRQAAMDAVQQWTYRPYLLNGDAVSVDTTVTVNFQLN